MKRVQLGVAGAEPNGQASVTLVPKYGDASGSRQKLSVASPQCLGNTPNHLLKLVLVANMLDSSPQS
eukprot:4983416-Pyramimonas_sp.AAC.1